MKKVRKKKLLKVIKSHSEYLMTLYFTNEHSLAVAGVSIIDDERAWEICDTLSHYAHILYRNFNEQSEVYEDEWAKLLLDFY